jgi:tetratricopeptide (TPR) repeat protein
LNELRLRILYVVIATMSLSAGAHNTVDVSPADRTTLNVTDSLASSKGTPAAIAYLAKAVGSQRSLVLVYRLALLHAETGGSGPQAIKLLREVLQQHPEFPGAARNFGVLLWQAGEAEAALPHLQQALDAGQDADVLLALGALYSAAGQAVAAEAALRQYVIRRPDNADAYLLLAQTLMGLERHADAGQVVKQAIATGPSTPGMWLLLANAALQAADYGAAIDALEVSLALHGPDPDTMWQLGRLYLYDGDQSRAFELLEQVSAPASDPAAAMDILEAMIAGEQANVAEFASKVLAGAGQSPRAHLLAGRAAMAEGQRARALELARNAVALDPMYAKAHLYLGQWLIAAGRVNDGIGHLRRIPAPSIYAAEALRVELEVEIKRTHYSRALVIIGELEKHEPDTDWSFLKRQLSAAQQ